MAQNPFDTIHPEDRARCEEAIASLAQTPGLSLELEHRIRRKDGTWGWVEGTFTSLFDDPDVGGLLATLRDITERKRAEEVLRASEARQTFLVGLGDHVRGLTNAAEIPPPPPKPSAVTSGSPDASMERWIRPMSIFASNATGPTEASKAWPGTSGSMTSAICSRYTARAGRSWSTPAGEDARTTGTGGV